MKMRSLLLVATLALAPNLVGCSPAWWQNFKNDPVQQTNTVLEAAQTIEAVASVAFAAIKPQLPADKQALAQSKFDEAIVTLNSAEDAVRAAVQAAADAKQDRPDFTKVITDLGSAVSAVEGVVAEFKALIGPTTPAPGVVAAAKPVPGFDLLHQQVTAFKARIGTK